MTMKAEAKDLIFVFFIGVYAGSMLVAVNAFKGTAPQEIIDIWSVAHFLGGFSLGYILNIYKKWSWKSLVFAALVPQLLWKLYEYITGYTLFMASLSNVFMDVVLGCLGAFLSLYVADYVMANRRIKNE